VIKREGPEIEQQIREFMKYDERTGALTWIKSRGRGRAGVVIGRVNKDGYLGVNFYRYSYLCHRIAWFLAKDSWPKNQIDHINGDKIDNRLCNLREATHRLNGENRRKPQPNNSTGFLGVTVTKSGKYQAQIAARGQRIYLGLFGTAEEASNAYLVAKRAMHEGCTI
jgi:hypothetical protein